MADVERVVRALGDLEAGLERGVEDRRRDLADTAAEAGRQLAVDDHGRDEESFRGVPLSGRLVERELLVRGDQLVVDEMRDELDVVDPVRIAAEHRRVRARRRRGCASPAQPPSRASPALVHRQDGDAQRGPRVERRREHGPDAARRCRAGGRASRGRRHVRAVDGEASRSSAAARRAAERLSQCVRLRAADLRVRSAVGRELEQPGEPLRRGSASVSCRAGARRAPRARSRAWATPGASAAARTRGASTRSGSSTGPALRSSEASGSTIVAPRRRDRGRGRRARARRRSSGRGGRSRRCGSCGSRPSRSGGARTRARRSRRGSAASRRLRRRRTSRRLKPRSGPKPLPWRCAASIAACQSGSTPSSVGADREPLAAGDEDDRLSLRPRPIAAGAAPRARRLEPADVDAVDAHALGERRRRAGEDEPEHDPGATIPAAISSSRRASDGLRRGATRYTLSGPAHRSMVATAPEAVRGVGLAFTCSLRTRPRV